MKVVVVGARADGQAHLVLEAIEAAGEHEVVAFLDETPGLAGRTVLGLPVVGPPSEVGAAKALGAQAAHIAIGDGAARERLAAAMTAADLELATVVHPNASVSPSATIGRGVFVGALAVVSAGAVVSDLALVPPTSLVSHHVHVGVAASLSPGARLGGRSRLGNRAFVGLGASVLPDRVVGDDATVGAGAVVTKDVPPGVTVVGIPARVR